MSESTNTTASAKPDPTATLSVRSFVIPVNGMLLLLPNTAVAEVADFKTPQPVAGAPLWLMGMMIWRGRSVPLIAIEPLLEQNAGVGGVHARAVVCNTLNANPTLPFVAILAQGLPRLVELKSDMIEIPAEQSDFPVIAASVILAGREAVIPDLDVLEKQLLQLGVRVG